MPKVATRHRPGKRYNARIIHEEKDQRGRVKRRVKQQLGRRSSPGAVDCVLIPDEPKWLRVYESSGYEIADAPIGTEEPDAPMPWSGGTAIKSTSGGVATKPEAPKATPRTRSGGSASRSRAK